MKNGKEYCPDERQHFLSGYSLDSYMQFLTNEHPSIFTTFKFISCHFSHEIPSVEIIPPISFDSRRHNQDNIFHWIL